MSNKEEEFNEKEIYAECNKCGKLIKGATDLIMHAGDQCKYLDQFYTEENRHIPTEDQLLADLSLMGEEIEDKLMIMTDMYSNCPKCGEDLNAVMKICVLCGEQINQNINYYDAMIKIANKMIDDHIKRFWTYFKDADTKNQYYDNLVRRFKRFFSGFNQGIRFKAFSPYVTSF